MKTNFRRIFGVCNFGSCGNCRCIFHLDGFYSLSRTWILRIWIWFDLGWQFSYRNRCYQLPNYHLHSWRQSRQVQYVSVNFKSYQLEISMLNFWLFGMKTKYEKCNITWKFLFLHSLNSLASQFSVLDLTNSSFLTPLSSVAEQQSAMLTSEHIFTETASSMM